MSQSNESKPRTAQDVIAEVAAALAEKVPEIFTGVVQARVKREVDRRVDIVDKAVAKRDQLEVEVRKLKPKKMVIINNDGTTTEVPAPVTPEEAKDFQKKLKDATEALARFDENFAKAVDKGDADAFDKLEKVCKG